MALKLDIESQFQLSNWVDIRLSRGEKGSFLFINNYQEDPVTTTIQYKGENLFGGNSVSLLARSGCILPLDWQLNEDVRIQYITSEISEITGDGSELVVKTAQSEFIEEMVLRGYTCENSLLLEQSAETKRIRLHAASGILVLRRM